MPVKFYLDNRPGKSGDSMIRVSISLFGERFITSTGYAINPTKWNAETKRVKQGASNAKKVNYNTINSRLGKIQSYFEAIEGAPTRPENIDIKALFEAEFAKPKKGKTIEGGTRILTFWDYFDLFCRERGKQNDWTKATYQKFDALKKHLKDFDRLIDFGTFTEAGLLRFVGFCRKDLDMKNSTIGKQLGYLKWFLNWATSKGYNTITEYQHFNPKLKQAEKKVVFLEWSELMKVYSYQVPANGTKVKLTKPNGEEYEKTVEDAGIKLMIFVGTRPEVEKYVEHYTDEMNATLLMPAGITSRASILYRNEDRLLNEADDPDRVYIEKVMPDKMKYNLEMLRDFSLIGELGILLDTVRTILR